MSSESAEQYVMKIF